MRTKEVLQSEPPFIAQLSDLLAAVTGGAAAMAQDKAVEASSCTEAAALRDFGQREAGEAQEVVDEAQTVDHNEIVTGLACEAADKTAEVTI